MISALKTDYSDSEVAAKQIPETVIRYSNKLIRTSTKQRLSDIEGAARAALRSYNNNVFKDLKVGVGHISQQPRTHGLPG